MTQQFTRELGYCANALRVLAPIQPVVFCNGKWKFGGGQSCTAQWFQEYLSVCFYERGQTRDTYLTGSSLDRKKQCSLDHLFSPGRTAVSF